MRGGFGCVRHSQTHDQEFYLRQGKGFTHSGALPIGDTLIMSIRKATLSVQLAQSPVPVLTHRHSNEIFDNDERNCSSQHLRRILNGSRARVE
jgi:hypothetical protein